MVMREATAISERRACQLAGLSRTVLHYESKGQPENEQLKARLVELAGERRRFEQVVQMENDAVLAGIGEAIMPAMAARPTPSANTTPLA